MCSSSSGIHINALIAAFIVYFCSTFLFFYYHLLDYHVISSKYDVLAIGNSSYYLKSTNHLTYSIAEIDSAEKNISIFNNGSNQFMNRSFSDHQLWYQKKMNRITENLPFSHNINNSTKKILLWTQNFNALPRYFNYFKIQNNITITNFSVIIVHFLMTPTGSEVIAALSGNVKSFDGIKMAKT